MREIVWFLVGFVTGAVLIAVLSWKFSLAMMKQILRTTTPFELAAWQHQRQRRADEADTRPGGRR